MAKLDDGLKKLRAREIADHELEVAKPELYGPATHDKISKNS